MENQTVENQTTNPEEIATAIVEAPANKPGEAPEKLPTAKPEAPKERTPKKNQGLPGKTPKGNPYTMFTPKKDGGWKKVKTFYVLGGRVALVEEIENVRPSSPRTEVKIYKGKLDKPATRSVYWLGPDTFRTKTHWVIGGVVQPPSPLA